MIEAARNETVAWERVRAMGSGPLCCGFLFLSEFSGVNAVFRIKIIHLVREIVCIFFDFLSKMIVYKKTVADERQYQTILWVVAEKPAKKPDQAGRYA